MKPMFSVHLAVCWTWTRLSGATRQKDWEWLTDNQPKWRTCTTSTSPANCSGFCSCSARVTTSVRVFCSTSSHFCQQIFWTCWGRFSNSWEMQLAYAHISTRKVWIFFFPFWCVHFQWLLCESWNWGVWLRTNGFLAMTDCVNAFTFRVDDSLQSSRTICERRLVTRPLWT